MKKGLLVVNGYMRNDKFDQLTQLYVEAAKKHKTWLKPCYTHRMMYGYDGLLQVEEIEDVETIDYVLFLDKDVRLARAFELRGIRVFNKASAIEACDDKAKTFECLQQKNIPMPQTMVAPLVFEGTYDLKKDTYFIEKLKKELGFPMIMKGCIGSFGKEVFKIDHERQLQEIRTKWAYTPHLYQKYIATSHGKDVRIQVVGKEIVASMLRTSTTDFRANITQGGQMSMYTCDEKFASLALQVCDLLALDFAGVDILFGENGEPLLCEVNSNAHIKKLQECTGIDVAEKIIAYIINELSP